jgi:ATP-dependent DNA helicase PIF1
VLNKVRVGIIDKQVKTVLNSRIGIALHNEYDIKPTGLFSKNCDVDRINDTELDKLAEDGRQFYEYKMEIVVYPGVSNKSAALEKFHKYCTAPTTLQICKGAQVMLLKNLDIQNGLANGSRGVITGFISDIPLVKFLNGEERLIDQNIWEVEENDKKILRAQQIPLKVAYAISIHKSQGCSLDYAEIDLSDIFEYGQAYVALSRVKSLEGLSIIDIDYDHIKAHPKATAYYESLL